MTLFDNVNSVFIEQPFQTFINLLDLTINYDYLNQHKNQLLIINFSSENWSGFENVIYEQLNKTDINFLLLTYDHTQHQQYPQMFYFPYWYHWSKENLSIVDVNEIKTYSLGCLNGNPRPHRIANYLKLRKKSYWDKISVSFFKVNDNNIPVRGDDLELLMNEVTEWSIMKSFLPLRNVSDRIVNLPQLTDSYLHLVAETTVSSNIFTTEKTWKPIAVGVPFVMWGNPGTMNFLKQQGIDIYDDVIDHKYYDTEKDARLRLNKLHEVIDDLILQGVDTIYNHLTDRVANNQIKFFNGEFDLAYLNIINNAIKQYA